MVKSFESSTPTMKTLFEESEFPRVKNLTKQSSWVFRHCTGCEELRTAWHVRLYGDQGPRCSERRESVVRVRLGRRLVNLSPLAQRTKTLSLVAKTQLGFIPITHDGQITLYLKVTYIKLVYNTMWNLTCRYEVLRRTCTDPTQNPCAY